MNILLPHHWLLEHLETDAQPPQIAELLSLSGPSVERVQERDGEAVYDIEVTTNRVDAMSVRGLAREAAVILRHADLPARLKALELDRPPSPAKSRQLPLPDIVNNPELSKRIMAVVLTNVKHTATPDWMARRLLQVDQNVHHAAIDITNYVTHELGHPCHAFDYDKIVKLGGQIIVTEAEAGESFTTLDGETYQTVGGEVVFKNAAGEIIDLPAIKGTANSSVDDSTTQILLWIESLDPHKVRFASMTHAIRTVAAQLNEKNVDPHLGEAVMLRGIEMYRRLCGAKVASQLYDDFPHPHQPTEISVFLSQLTTYLGVELPSRKVAHILEQLGCQVVVRPGAKGPERMERAVSSDGTAGGAVGGTADSTSPTDPDTLLTVTPPSFRPDLTIPADLIEEVARIYGYHRLPGRLMATALPTDKPSGDDFVLEDQLKNWLAALGWQEVYTYSMVSRQLAAESGWPFEEHLELVNPLTEDRSYLRQSLVPSLREALDANPNRLKLGVFEQAYTYHPRQGQLPEQVLHLTLARRGDHRQLRGLLEAMVDKFFLPELKLETVEAGRGAYRQLAEISTRARAGQTDRSNQPSPDERLGTLGITDDGTVILDLLVTQLAAVKRGHPQYQPITANPPLIEDMTFSIPASRAIGPVLDSIKTVSPLIERVELTSQYRRNFTFRITYQDPDGSLSAEQVAPLRQAIAERMAADHHAELVGQL
ncbi:MAG: hypothetical protein COU69_01045 [Candidatus Pacebacteria bacterium CG10_big_fil_rev_8_21_14_0_10_56_10]|nr:MAG: hypothetical protein COU69_01045 [Candidatus Pacebacteria bacterium CG10_big_fil_rev_8_21_14_0_10_56_10]